MLIVCVPLPSLLPVTQPPNSLQAFAESSNSFFPPGDTRKSPDGGSVKENTSVKSQSDSAEGVLCVLMQCTCVL